MRKSALLSLRLGLGITFIWIGWLIWSEPLLWGSFMQEWAQNKIPGSLEQFMKSTAIIDMLLGAWIIIGVRVKIAAFFASLHLAGVLVSTASGMENVIVRDIGLLGASIALFLES